MVLNFFIVINNLFDHIINGIFDLIFGINASGRIEPDELIIKSSNKSHGKAYQGTHYRLLLKTFWILGIDFKERVFIDFGSGKGRALIAASFFPFQYVVGLEYCESLHLEAINNIEIFQKRFRKNSPIHPLLSDAANFEIPIGRPKLIYFYNPFDEVIMRKCLLNILKSGHPDDLIVYINPLRDYLFTPDHFPCLLYLPHFNHNKVIKVFGVRKISPTSP